MEREVALSPGGKEAEEMSENLREGVGDAGGKLRVCV